MLITPAALQALNTSFKKTYQDAFDNAMKEVLYKTLSTVVPSTSKSNTYGWLKTIPKFREWVGDRIFNNLAAHAYEILNKKFELSIEVPREDIEDDNIGVYKPSIQLIGGRAAEHPDDLLFALIKAGTSTDCYDGQYFFDTDHDVGGSSVSNYDNGGGTAWYLLDLSKPVKPFITQERTPYEFASLVKLTDEVVFHRDVFQWGGRSRRNAGYGLWQMAFCCSQTLNSTYFNSSLEAMMAFCDDQGEPLMVKPTHLLVPPSLRAQAKALIKAERDAAGASNINYKDVEVIVTQKIAA